MDGIIINNKVYKVIPVETDDCDGCDLWVNGGCIRPQACFYLDYEGDESYYHFQYSEEYTKKLYG